MMHSSRMRMGSWGPWVVLVALCCWAGGAHAQSPAYPSLDGSNNNKENPSWGAAKTPYLRLQVPADAYNTSADAMAGANRPSPRAISLALTNNPYFKASSVYNTSYLLTALGQLVSHDTTRAVSDPAGPAPIPIPPGDPLFAAFNSEQQPLLQQSRQALNFSRSEYTRAPGGSRQQINYATAFLDASGLYGQGPNVSDVIRARTAGLLLDDGNRLLPLNVDPVTGEQRYNMKNAAGRVPDTQLRLSANLNVNQNPFPLVMNSLLLREHNRRARMISDDHPDWGDEEIFQEARKWVIAHFQQIALVDYMTGLGIPLPPYQAYNASLNPSIDNFFTTVAYRYGHTTINDIILRLGEDWGEHPKGHITMANSYYNPEVVLDAGIEPILRGLIAMPQAQVEPRWAAAISGNFLGQSTVNGTDLAAINIQRGRDHGIPDYNTCRRLMGLPPLKSINDLTPDPQLAATLQQLYGSINNLDAYVGGLVEPHYQQSHVGELFYLSIRDQFIRLRDGDYWYYENAANNKLFNETEVQEIRTTSLRDIIARNTNITDLPRDIWVATGAAGSCAAGSGGSDTLQELRVPLLQGQAQLEVTKGSQDGWVRVKLASAGQGWLGFGVAEPGAASGMNMVGADMVVGRMVDGAPVVKRYHAFAHAPPDEAPEADRLKVISFLQENGQITMEFERPLAASSNAADGSNAIPVDGPVRFIMARGPSNDFGTMANYHGHGNSDVVDLQRLFGSSGVLPRSAFAGGVAATSDAVAKRRAHGALMAVNFMVVMPLGALAARQLRCHWLKSPALRASLFYIHIATQLSGVIIATVGFILATRLFDIHYTQVAWGHGKLGVSILVIVYSQVIVGFMRPTATAPTLRRQIWDVVHSLLGRAAMLLGVMNVCLGIIIFSTGYGGNLTAWGGLCAAALGTITLTQYSLDRQEKYAVLKADQEVLRRAGGGGAAAAVSRSKDVLHGPNDVDEGDSEGFGDGGDGLHDDGGVDEGGSGSGGSPGSGPDGRRFKLTASNLKLHHEAAAAAADGNDGNVRLDGLGPGGGGAGGGGGLAGGGSGFSHPPPHQGQFQGQFQPGGGFSHGGQQMGPGFSHAGLQQGNGVVGGDYAGGGAGGPQNVVYGDARGFNEGAGFIPPPPHPAQLQQQQGFAGFHPSQGFASGPRAAPHHFGHPSP